MHHAVRLAGRQSWRGQHTCGIYVADSSISALWEVILRGVRPNGYGQVYLAPGDYAGRSIVSLRARRDIPFVMRVDKPRRYRFVENGSMGDTTWELCCTFPVHAISHGVAHAVDQFFAERNLQHAGLGWKSNQYQDEMIYVLYAPPFAGDDWDVGEIVDLSAPEGIALLRHAVEAAGFIWVDHSDEAPEVPAVPVH